jgi:hypothetical protein
MIKDAVPTAREFRFSEGQCVSHRSGGMSSVVIEGNLTAGGREHYRLWEIDGADRRERWFLGDFLVPTTGRDPQCEGCGLGKFCELRHQAAA